MVRNVRRIRLISPRTLRQIRSRSSTPFVISGIDRSCLIWDLVRSMGDPGVPAGLDVAAAVYLALASTFVRSISVEWQHTHHRRSSCTRPSGFLLPIPSRKLVFSLLFSRVEPCSGRTYAAAPPHRSGRTCCHICPRQRACRLWCHRLSMPGNKSAPDPS